MTLVRRAIPFLLAFAVGGCITVNIYFPAPEVRAAAEQIVDETWGANAAVQPSATQGATGDESSLLDLFAPSRAEAQQADINVSTAAIRKLKDSMRVRAEQLKPYLAAGNVGIGNDGMLVVRNLANVALKDQADIRRLVEAENRDRASLYREIAKANNFGDDRVDDIQKIFALTWVEKAEKGWPIQKGDGSWGTK
jgi:uncharacterized protein YdbL (DUF1318 family)